MKFIKPTYQFEDQTNFDLVGILKHIEKCARVCYKSEDKITDDSYIKFVDNLIKKDHARPLEFGTVYLFIPISKSQEYQSVIEFYRLNPWSRCNKVEESGYYITTNYRVIIENKLSDHLNFLCSPTQHHDQRHTIHFIISRGCMDEFRTHVTLSHLAESTRYCNYTNQKHNGLTFIIPQWAPNIKEEIVDSIVYLLDLVQPPHNYSEPESDFVIACMGAEIAYNNLIQGGLIPQEAREVLPLSIKSELISCGYLNDWENFIYRRDDIGAQKEARFIAGAIRAELEKFAK